MALPIFKAAKVYLTLWGFEYKIYSKFKIYSMNYPLGFPAKKKLYKPTSLAIYFQEPSVLL